MIRSEWNTENGFTYTCSVPEGATALLKLPVFTEKLTVNGKEHSGAEYETENGRYLISLAAGEYEFIQ